MPRDDRDFQVLRASCALPILFPIININGQPYMDGGIADPIPAEQAIRSGCDKNIVILTQERGYRKESEKMLSYAARLYNNYPGFAEALSKRTDKYNEALSRIGDLEREGKVFVIAPHKMHGVKRTEADPEILRDLHRQGYGVFKEVLPQIRKYLEN
jgi:predicted patatin/cPLA2 family phospholipase